MKRTLPWLKNGVKPAAKSSPRPSSTREPSPKRTRVTTPLGSDDDLDFNTTGISTPSRRRLLRGTRTPSTSPPPAPPNQMPMREGWAEDDIWMMVEDEFYSTAQSYTQHLHHAEYKRLKEIAKNRENEIKTRPTDNGRSTMTVDGKMALKVAAQEKNVKNALKNISAGSNKDDEDMEEEEDPWVGTQLAGLMDSPRKATKLRASRLGAGRSETKAAKGFQRSSQTDTTGKITHARRVSFDDEEPKAMSPTRARSNWRRERETQRQSTSFEGKTEEEDEQDDDDLDDDLDASVRSKPRNVERARLEPARAVATALSPPQQLGNKRHAKSPREQLHATTSSNSPVARADGPRRPSIIDVSRETAASRPSTIRAEKQKEPSSPPRSSLRKSRNHDSNGLITSSKTSPRSSEDSTHALVPASTNSGEMAAPSQGMSIFARRRAERERAKREQEAKEAKEHQGRRNSIEIPTFMV